MSRARAILVVRRASGLHPSDRSQMAAWLRSQADYLERAADFMPTLTLKYVEREAAPEGDQFKGQHWHAGGRGGRATKHCGFCFEAGHTIRSCPEKKLAEMEAQKA